LPLSSLKGFGEYSVFNLGTGIGYSVLDMVSAMKVASGRLDHVHPVASRHVVSYHVVKYNIVSYNTISCHIASFHASGRCSNTMHDRMDAIG
jgi:UDP-glucose 4-epimerase